MSPALLPGDYLLVRRGGRAARPGDVVVLRPPDRGTLHVIKRISRIEPDGRLWVEGDQPAASDDSRLFGAVAPDRVDGRVLGRYWPWWARARRAVRWTPPV